MAQGNPPIYSIQRTYILKPVLTPENKIITCDERIDIPTIEPLTSVEPLFYKQQPLNVIPCIELAGEFLSEFNLTFETNEGVTVLPIVLDPRVNPLVNPYIRPRYVLVLPRGATGVKSCKLIQKSTRKEVQHKLTFGVMPPPYNYDNALLGGFSTFVQLLVTQTGELVSSVRQLKLTKETLSFPEIKKQKGSGKKPIIIAYGDGKLFYETKFNYPLSSEPTIHNPKITFHAVGRDFVYTLSLSRTTNNVSIDLFTGMITVYDGVTGEIMQQFKLPLAYYRFGSFSIENFDDIDDSVLLVTPRGSRVHD